MDMNGKEFDALVETERRRYIEIGHARAGFKKALEASRAAPVSEEAATLWLHSLRHDLVRGLREAERRMLDTCEVRQKGPLKLLVFIPAAARVRVQKPDQAFAELGREIAAIFGYMIGLLDIAAYDAALQVKKGVPASETYWEALECMNEVITFWPLLGYNIKVLYGLRHCAQAEATGALCASLRQFPTLRAALDRQRRESRRTSRREEMAVACLSAIAALPTAAEYAGLRPEHLRIGDYTVLTMGTVFDADFIPDGLIPLTVEAGERWHGKVDEEGKRDPDLAGAVESEVRGYHRQSGAEVSEGTLPEQEIERLHGSSRFEKEVMDREELSGWIEGARLRGDEEQIMQQLLANPSLVSDNIELASRLSLSVESIDTRKRRAFGKIRQAAVE